MPKPEPMSRQWKRAIIASLMMILSSLAGCIGGDVEDVVEEEEEVVETGTVMVSTYHVEQLVSAVAGDLLTVEMMSTSNIPVHDYTPTGQDLIRLQNADVFFYHGLGLEPWVEDALATMGDDAPLSASTHAMPNGADPLDYQSLMEGKLCTSLNEPSATVVHVLADHSEDAQIIHGDDGVHNLAMPEDDHDEDLSLIHI